MADILRQVVVCDGDTLDQVFERMINVAKALMDLTGKYRERVILLSKDNKMALTIKIECVVRQVDDQWHISDIEATEEEKDAYDINARSVSKPDKCVILDSGYNLVQDIMLYDDKDEELMTFTDLVGGILKEKYCVEVVRVKHREPDVIDYLEAKYKNVSNLYRPSMSYTSLWHMEVDHLNNLSSLVLSNLGDIFDAKSFIWDSLHYDVNLDWHAKLCLLREYILTEVKDDYDLAFLLMRYGIFIVVDGNVEISMVLKYE